MSTKQRRIDTREYRWWAAVAEWCEAKGIAVESAAHDALFEIVLAAIEEAGAIEAGSRGGLKGGRARAAKMTPRERSAAASKAARARWKAREFAAFVAKAEGRR